MHLDDKTATLSMGGETKSVALATLANQWSGSYTVLWRMPPQARENIQPGERGPAVAWLSAQLGDGQSAAAEVDEDAVFDAALTKRLKQFQLAHGLISDGVVGPQTLMRLSGISDASGPQLARKRAEK
jgi:general secretion pathway protein A